MHTQTLEQTEQGKGPKPESIRTRCNELIKILEQVLSSSVFNVNFRTIVSIPCEQCGTKIVRRVHHDQEAFIANCIECSASYNITETDNHQFNWKPLVREINCINESCNGSAQIWENDIKLGSQWECADCGGKNKFLLGIAYVSQPQNNSG
ncbi:MAG: hypothetical protein KZQ83_18390 [gamma proteobacterium symbiont of Taylorina sp.]|nr:hypothetical protein [gamma proteobacterium symbiont of Taylorina sp.]